MKGYDVWIKPGYDTHGLPIEVMVEKKLDLKRKQEIINTIGIKKFNELCRNYADQFVTVLNNQFKSLAVWMDWNNPYLTYTKNYISSIWWAINEAHKKNLLKEDVRVFHWCPRCETVLSEHEVAQEYRDVQDPAIYVKFPIKEKENESILVWTTTPWTLPSNTGIMVHPKIKYSKILLIKTQEILYLASKRLNVIKDEYKILDEFKGNKLKGIKYNPPLLKEVPALQKLISGHQIILSSKFVSEEEGTGCVHTAPEHGKEDFEVARENNLPIITLIDDTGLFVEDAGKYSKQNTMTANENIIQDLKSNHMLYHIETISHTYPHCWRCKTRLILKSTRQWLLSVSQLRSSLVSENKKINWIPEWAGKQRFQNWVENAKDWVISRQRFWGTPLPVWKCNKCDDIEVMGSVQELENKIGKTLIDIHRPLIDTPQWDCKCGGIKKRVPEVIDVWIDSGAASWASLGYPDETQNFDKLWPVEFITEDHDQTRGWFYSMLAMGIIAFGTSPYKNVLMHGFALDSNGKGMHKSLGNVVYPEELTEKYGTDALRLFLLRHAPWQDSSISNREIEESMRDLNILSNIFEFYSTYANLDDFKISNSDIIQNKYDDLLEEDKWILSKFETLVKNCTDNLENYHVHNTIRLVLNFAVENLSRKYIRLIRRRVWILNENWEKTSTYFTLHYILKGLTLLLAPFAPHFSEYYYQNYIKKFEENTKESLHLENWPILKTNWINPKIEKNHENLWEIINVAYSIRQRKNMKIRQPLQDLLIPHNIHQNFSSRCLEILQNQINILEINSITPEKEPIEYEFKLKPNVLGPKYGNKFVEIVKIFNTLNQKSISKKLEKNNIIDLDLDGEKIKISKDDLEINIITVEPYVMENINEQHLFLNVDLTPDLLQIGLIRDLVRYIQENRKNMNLEMMEKIDLILNTENTTLKNAILKHINYIKTETRTVNISFDILTNQKYTQYKIEGINIKILIKTISN